jgi:hypothetical protein
VSVSEAIEYRKEGEGEEGGPKKDDARIAQRQCKQRGKQEGERKKKKVRQAKTF